MAEIHLSSGRRDLCCTILLWPGCRPTLGAQAVTMTNTRRFGDRRGARRFRDTSDIHAPQKTPAGERLGSSQGLRNSCVYNECLGVLALMAAKRRAKSQAHH